jgi:hypothetical protein
MISTSGPTTAVMPAPSIVLRAPYSEVHVTNLDAEDHISMRAKQLAAIIRVMPSDGYAPHIARIIPLLATMAAELVEKNSRGDDVTAVVDDIRDLLFMTQRDDVTDHIHWLCLQIAQELADIFSAMSNDIIASDATISHGVTA